MGSVHVLVVIVCAATLCFAMLAAPALGAEAVTTPGSGPGQTSEPRGLAVDRSSGDPESGRLYVADKGNDRVDVFDSSGGFLFDFDVEDPISVAVDDDEASSSLHDVYVVDLKDRRIEKFKPDGELLLTIGVGEYSSTGPEITEDMLVAVGPGGEVYVVDVRRTVAEAMLTTRLRRYEASGGPPIFETDVVSVPRESVVGGNLRGFAVDSAGDAYIRNGGAEPSLCKYDPEGEKVTTWGQEGCLPDAEVQEAQALAMGQAGDLFVAGFDAKLGSGGKYSVIAEFDASSGDPLRRFGYGELEGFVEGLAVRPAALGVYASNGGVVLALSFPPPGPLIAPEACAAPAAQLHSTRAVLRAEVNPEGSPATYHFQYVDDAVFQVSGFATATRVPPSAGEDPVLDANPKLHLASQEATGLTPETKYHCRVVAEDSEGHEAIGLAGEFETRPPIELLASWASEVGTEEAKLSAEVNPLGSPTTGYFEYVDEASYAKDVEEGGDGFGNASQAPDVSGGAQPLAFGEGEEPVVRSAVLSSLAEATTFHYRFVAKNAFKTIIGPEHTFHTFAAEGPSSHCPANEAFRSGFSALLPDCRVYELVSPLEKNNADVVPPPEGTTGLPAALEESSVSGEKLAYASTRAFADPESSPYTPQYIARRDIVAGEWVTHSINSPRGTAIVPAAAQRDTEFKAFSPDLCQAWQRPVAEPPTGSTLAAGEIPHSLNIYRRSDDECGGPSYAALTTVAPPSGSFDRVDTLELQGISAAGEEGIYLTQATLPGTGGTGALEGKRQLYVQGPEGTRFACIKPGGAPSATGCSGGTINSASAENRVASLQGAISADGQRIFWSEAEAGPGPIYLRQNPFAKGAECSGATARCTLAVSKAGEELTGGGAKAQFWGAAADGSRAIFSVGSDLYEFVTETKATNLIAHSSLGVAGTSADATKVYFASGALLGGPNAEGKSPIAGKANLYLHRAGGSEAFIATLAAGDTSQGPANPTPLNKIPYNHTAQASPSGEQLAFMSIAGPISEKTEGVPAPSGYDNTDAVSGKADAEAYLYDASANGGAGRLVCASCNPGGGRPVGFDRGARIQALANDTWVAGQIPAWENTLYQPRALSENGQRLIFTSTDALTPRDTNGAQDVYQWEAAGEGGCTEASTAFSESNGGCVNLISSGTSPRDSELRDASASGDDVFIGTLASLVPWDYGLVDIYDARANGGLPAPPSHPAECEGEACQSPPAPPNPPLLGSTTFEPADLPEKLKKKKRRCPKGKRKGQHGGKKACEKRHRGAKRHHRLYPHRWRRGEGGTR